MSAHWKEECLGELCDISIGRTPSRAEARYWRLGTLPWLSIADMSQGVDLAATRERITEAAVAECGGRLVMPGTLVMSFKLSVGKLGFVRVPLYTNEAIAALPVRHDKKLEPRFLYRALQTARLADGADRAVKGLTLNSDKLARIRIRYPASVGEQRCIADILDKADEIRRKCAGAITLTEEMLRSAFLDMFGDPMTNPKGWKVMSVTDLCESKQYGTAEKANSDGRGLPVLRMNNITYAGEVDTTDLKWVDLPASDAAKLDLRVGDVLFNRVNSHELVGKTAAWQGGKGFTFAGYLIRLRMLVDTATGDYVAAAMNMPSMKRRLMAMAKPSINMANISSSDLDRLLVPVPPLSMQKRYGAIKARVSKLRDRYVVTSESSRVLFYSLVGRAFSGQLIGGKAAC